MSMMGSVIQKQADKWQIARASAGFSAQLGDREDDADFFPHGAMLPIPWKAMPPAWRATRCRGLTAVRAVGVLDLLTRWGQVS